MIVKNSLNYSYFPPYYEVNEGVSLTVPDQTLTVSQILERYTRGLPLGGKVPIYDEEDTLPDVRTLDLAERQELREQYEEELSLIRRRKSYEDQLSFIKKRELYDKDRGGQSALAEVPAAAGEANAADAAEK